MHCIYHLFFLFIPSKISFFFSWFWYSIVALNSILWYLICHDATYQQHFLSTKCCFCVHIHSCDPRPGVFIYSPLSIRTVKRCVYCIRHLLTIHPVNIFKEKTCIPKGCCAVVFGLIFISILTACIILLTIWHPTISLCLSSEKKQKKKHLYQHGAHVFYHMVQLISPTTGIQTWDCVRGRDV